MERRLLHGVSLAELGNKLYKVKVTLSDLPWVSGLELVGVGG